MERRQVLCAVFDALAAAEQSLRCDAAVTREHSALEVRRGLPLRETNAVAFSLPHEQLQTNEQLALRLDNCASADGQTAYIPHPQSIPLLPVGRAAALSSPQLVEFEAISDASEWAAASAAVLALALALLTQVAVGLLRRLLCQRVAARKRLSPPSPVLLLTNGGARVDDGTESAVSGELGSDEQQDTEELNVPIPETEEEWQRLFERVYDGDCIGVIPTG